MGNTIKYLLQTILISKEEFEGIELKVQNLQGKISKLMDSLELDAYVLK